MMHQLWVHDVTCFAYPPCQYIKSRIRCSTLTPHYHNHMHISKILQKNYPSNPIPPWSTWKTTKIPQRPLRCTESVLPVSPSNIILSCLGTPFADWLPTRRKYFFPSRAVCNPLEGPVCHFSRRSRFLPDPSRPHCDYWEAEYYWVDRTGEAFYCQSATCAVPGTLWHARTCRIWLYANNRAVCSSGV